MYLNCHTAFSFQYGTLSPRELFEEARRCGVRKLAITEINNTASLLEMLRIREENFPVSGDKTRFGKEAYVLDLAVGVEFRNSNNALLYVMLAKNNAGFEQINRFLSYHNRTAEAFPLVAPDVTDTIVLYPYGEKDPEELRPHEYLGVQKHQINQFLLHCNDAYAQKSALLIPVTFRPPYVDESGKLVHRDHNIHRLLRSIALNTLLSKLPGEMQASRDEYMKAEPEVRLMVEKLPFLVDRARSLLDQCTIAFNLKEDKNKKTFTGDYRTDVDLLREETAKGYQRRYGADPSVWKSHIEKELRIIEAKNFTAYYLITHDLIRFASQQGYDFVGRGSGANSTVAYCLGITNVDPIELDLYFERFLNEERSSPPDFDIDFSWDNRDAIYEYLFTKHGAEHVCLLGTHTTYQERSIVRELGKVFGLPKDEIDDLVEFPEQNRNRDHIRELIFRYAAYMTNLPSNISIHAGGVLITERPIYAYTTTDVPPKGLPVSQFEMHAAEDFGIYKFDILSQRGLAHIKETVKHVRRNRGVDVDVHRFADFKKDEGVKELMRSGKTMGCFYVESPSMRMLLRKLSCDDYLTLVAASSIIRPGVSSSGMMKAYIQRFHQTVRGETYDSIHPLMDTLMKETFGVMVYQEDVIKVAHHFAGLTLTEADVLRRGMSGKYRSREEFSHVRNKFFNNCRRRNYDEHVINRVWREIESFAGFSFAKGHSASYAVESYQSLFLKAHYPLEFMVGVINNFGGFYKTEFYVHEARRLGACIEAPCVNRSEYLTTLFGCDLYLGFGLLKSLETSVAHRLVAERDRHGAYSSFDNFLRRNTLGLEQVRILIRVGAFRFTSTSKQQLLWEAMLYFGEVKSRRNTTSSLFDTAPNHSPLPELQRAPMEDAFDELELLGFPLCAPFDLLPTGAAGDIFANELETKKGQAVTLVGYVVTTKPSTTKAGQAMNFGTFYDARGDVFDTVHFPDVHRKFPMRGRGFYRITGQVEEDFGVYTVTVSHLEKLSMIHKRPERVFQEVA